MANRVMRKCHSGNHIKTIKIIIYTVFCAFSFNSYALTQDHQHQLLIFEAVGQYHKGIEYFENKLNYESADITNLAIVNGMYHEIKNYKKFDETSELLLKRLDKKGHEIRHIFTPYELIVAQVNARQAQHHIDFGDYPAALGKAENAVQYLSRVRFSEVPIPIYFLQVTSAEELFSTYLVEIYNAAGLSNALMAKSKNAKYYISLMESITFDLIPHMWNNFLAPRIARIYIVLKDYELAKKYLQKYVPLSAHEKDMQNKPQVKLQIEKDFMLSKIFYENNQKEKAKIGYDKLLSNPFSHNYGSLYYMALSDRASIYLEEGNIDKAISLLKLSIEEIERQRSTINFETEKIGFVGDKQAVYHILVDGLFKAGRFEEAFAYAERGKARALVDMLAFKKQFGGGEKSDQDQLTDLLYELDKTEIEAIIQSNQPSSHHQKSMRGIVAQMKRQLSQTKPELASLVTVTPPDVEEIIQFLPPEETLVEYFGSEDTFFAFVVSNSGVRGVKIVADGLDDKIRSFRKHIMDQKLKAIKSDGQNLYTRLIHPLKGMIHTKNLTIVPHGALHYLPFSALYSNGQYLIDKYNLRILPSASVMKFLKDQREGHVGNMLAYGNPDLGDPQFDLPGAQKEAIAIANDMPNSQLFIRKQATETSLKNLGYKYRYVHFAMHGTFDAEKPLASSLMMVADSENDGMLTAGELYDLRLPADLVSLSSCETALGKIANGDDVVGFTRGFLYAGVSSIVSSLWKVDDQATSIMMQQFYKSLKVADKRKALRTAQLKVKDTYNSNPFFWAAFQLTGSVQ